MSTFFFIIVGFIFSPLAAVTAQSPCPDYIDYSTKLHEPASQGRYKLSYQRPVTSCRTFQSPAVEAALSRLRNVITDPDLFRLFENSYPNTLDTAIKWKGTAAGSDEELTFIITGDINAMWLRDSSNQMQSYLPVLNASTDSNSIASLYRGTINLQARYLLTSPYCNAFQPPVESKIPPAKSSQKDTVFPRYSPDVVFECKYELDSLAAFLQLSADYYAGTSDLSFFSKYRWVDAVKKILEVAEDMKTPTYAANGSVLSSPYTFIRTTESSTETLANRGLGNPVANGTGLIRSAFRPSDDSTIHQLFIPANMMFSRYLGLTASIMAQLPNQSALATRMAALAEQLRTSITKHGILHHAKYGPIYAYEVDGFGSTTIMDDANIPSLLAAPFQGYLDASDPVYQSTRRLILSGDNPYFMRGPVINAVGGPHEGPGAAWPMASIVRILTSNDDDEITGQLKEILGSTNGLGLIHETVDSFNASQWTRQWFSWANGLFGQMILDLERRKPGILKTSFQ